MAEKILVVDDEALILTAVERALSKVGYSISRAQNMKELEDAVNGAPFDLLITDIYMQEGSIKEIVEMVKRTSPSAKILMMSGSFNKNVAENFIEKPFSIEALRKRVKEILHEPS